MQHEACIGGACKGRRCLCIFHEVVQQLQQRQPQRRVGISVRQQRLQHLLSRTQRHKQREGT